MSSCLVPCIPTGPTDMSHGIRISFTCHPSKHSRPDSANQRLIALVHSLKQPLAVSIQALPHGALRSQHNGHLGGCTTLPSGCQRGSMGLPHLTPG